MSAENTGDNIMMMQTYLESSSLEKLPEEFTEDALHHAFSSKMAYLHEQLDKYNSMKIHLDSIRTQTDWGNADKEKQLSAQELLAQEASIEHLLNPLQNEFAQAARYNSLLQRYGNEFAQLYKVKENHERSGFADRLDFVELDITDNGDILTQDQYYRMRADINDRLYEVALHVELEDENPEETDNIAFNFGVLEFNQPNQPPQTKVQLSFDDNTLEKLDEAKLKRIFDFCESHGISVADLQIRRFDGSLAEDLIREKIEKFLEQAQKGKEAQIQAENQKELTQTETRHKELEAELQNIVTANNGQMPEGLSWDNVSSDVVPQNRVMKATNNSALLAREFANVSQQATDSKQTSTQAANISSQTISKGVAIPANVPQEDMQREIIENTKTKARTSTEKTENLQTQPISEPQSHQISSVAPSISGESLQTAAASQNAQQQQITQQTPPPPKISKKKVEEGFDKLLGPEGWNKVQGRSYFKEHTGWFGTGWTEYIIYDNEDKENRRKDGIRQKDGSVKYTYSFKLFLQVEKDGTLNFTYRTPNKRKLGDNYIKDIAGKLKDLGYTHINFPVGVSNEEKGVWRQAMAENGLIPLNMGLDSHKAAKMIEIAKEKLSAEKWVDYKYRLALQMKRYNEQKGKHVSASEQAFIDNLINSHPDEIKRLEQERINDFNKVEYSAFMNAYNEILKGKIEDMLQQQNLQTGSPDKFAAYLTLRKVFDVYREALKNENKSLLNIPDTILTPAEKRQIRDLGLGGNVKELQPRQLDKLFDILYTRQSKEEYAKFRDLLLANAFDTNRGPRVAPNVVFTNELSFARGRAKGIARELERLGVSGFKPFEDTNLRFEFERFFKVDKPAYERAHPNAQQSQQSAPQNGNTSANEARSNDVAVRASRASAEIQKRRLQQTAEKAPTEVKAPEAAKVDVTQVVAQSKVRSNN